MQHLILYFTAVWALAYAAVMILYLYGWRSLRERRPEPGYLPHTGISVIIAARNESENIGACVNGILSGLFPRNLLEILVIDDHSTDTTADLPGVKRPLEGVRLLRLADHLTPGEPLVAYKKKAIQIGVQQARFPLIAVTDADTVAGEKWLVCISETFEKNEKIQIAAAPVLFHRESNIIERFQSLDFLGMMGVTAAGIALGFQRMGNGANMAFRKSAFERVDGYEGNAHIASGDDLFLMQKIARRFPESTAFIKNPEAAVRTFAQPDLPSFVDQRIRWASKNAALPEWPVRLILLTVFCFSWALMLAGLCSIFRESCVYIFLAGTGLKAMVDYVFLREMCVYFDRRDLLRYFPVSFFLHIPYIALIGAVGLIRKEYRWKGRLLRAV